MKGSLALVGVCALVFVGAAFAANGSSFFDAGGDALNSPDVTGVSIASDDAGVITVKLTFGNRPSWNANDIAAIGLDTDQNPDTGSVFYGGEWELDLEGTTATVLQATPDGFYTDALSPASYKATFADGSVTFSFKASDFGVTSGFNLYTVGEDRNWLDVAPDIRTVNYQLVSGASAPVLQADRRAPFDHAFKSAGTHGKIVQLIYLAMDGRGETSDSIVVYKGKKVLKRINYILEDTSPLLPYVARWKAPKKTKGKLRFCVSSVDRAGNKSNTSCAQLTIK